MIEIWRPIEGYESSHEVSNLGRVRSIDRVVTWIDKNGVMVNRPAKGRVLKPRPIPAGYLMVSPCGRDNKYIHALVAAAFIGPRPLGYDVNHKDGAKSNNASSNLEYVTRKGNMKHARETGLWDNRGERHGNATYSDELVRRAYDMVLGGMSRRKVAEALGLDRRYVGRITNGSRRGLPPIPQGVPA